MLQKPASRLLIEAWSRKNMEIMESMKSMESMNEKHEKFEKRLNGTVNKEWRNILGNGCYFDCNYGGV